MAPAVLSELFKYPRYVMLAIAIALIVMLATIWLSSPSLIGYIFTSNLFSLTDKMKILWLSLGLFKTNFTMYSRVVSTIIAVLAGINISMLVYLFKKHIVIQKAAGTSVIGILGGFLGIGCSTCGSIVLATVFGVGAATAFIGILPFNGAEFGIVSIAILIASILFVAKKLQAPMTCDENAKQ